MLTGLYRTLALSMLCTVLIVTRVSADQVQAPLLDNMGFEIMDGDNLMPLNWIFEGPGYSGCCDSLITFSGERSFRIDYIDIEPAEGYGCIEGYIPFTFEEEVITLSGWLRTRDVEDDCYAGLYLILYDKQGNPVSNGNMFLDNPHESTEWHQLEVSMENSRFGCELELGAFLYGTGTIWVDELELQLDGKPICEAVTRMLPGAELDHEFDMGSGLEFTEINNFQLESLVLLGKVWAFLKYHHPQIGRGNINWDYALMRTLPSLLDAATEAERQQSLLYLIEGLEPVSVLACSLPSPDEIRLSPDLDWINNPEVGPELAATLMNIYEGRFQEEHYYVRGTPFSRFNECGYEDMAIPDTGFRLLALYRYWGIIEYFFPYRYAIDGDWNDVLREYIPVFVTADDPLSYQLALQKLIVSIGDSHTKIVVEPDALRKFFGSFFTPVQLAYVENQWAVDGFTHESALSAGIEIGDVITAIEGRPISERVEELHPYISASTEGSFYERLGRKLLRGNTGTVNLSVQRGCDTLLITIPRMEEDNLDSDMADRPAAGDGPYTLLDDETGYVYVGMLTRGDVEEMMEEFRHTNGMILDLRDYPGDFVIYSVADFLLPEETAFVQFTYPDYSNPGTFIWKGPRTAGGGDSPYEGRIAILIDEGSVSQAEFTAMAWRLAPHVRVFGSPSDGADGDVVFVRFPGGIRTRFTGIGVYYPDGRETQRVGIQPDVLVRPTVEGLQAGRDEVLEAAVEWLAESGLRSPESPDSPMDLLVD
jgi:C-terminal processing protease CtpA/Prc